ncbi:MAG: hypothetical protein AB7E55_31075 [Pigmentiphaga sp.]
MNVLYRMVKRWYSKPFRLICITDDPSVIVPEVEGAPLWQDFLSLRNPTWPTIAPNCYPRLRAFSKEFKALAGERFVCIDLDVVITGDLMPLWDRPEDFVIYASAKAKNHYNGSMWMMRAGCRSEVWEDFDPVESPKLANRAGNQGSDQGWIQYRLGKKEAIWTVKDGIYSYRGDMKWSQKCLPADARIVVFHGIPKPWDKKARDTSPWIDAYYR